MHNQASDELGILGTFEISFWKKKTLKVLPNIVLQII